MGPNRPILILIGIILCIVHLSAESSPSQKPKKSDGPPPLSPSVPMPGSNSSTSSLSKSKASQQKNETTPMKKPADDGAPKRGDKNPRPFGSPGPVPPNLRRKGPLRRKGYSDGYSGGENNEYDGQTSNYGVGYDSYGKNYGGNYYGSGEKAYKSYNYLIDDYICDMDASIIVVTNSEKRYKQTYSGKQDYGKQQGYESNDQQNYGKEYGGKSAAYESQPYGNKADYGKKEAYPSGEAYGKKEEYGYNKKGQYDVDEEYSHGSYKEKYTGGERYKRSNGYGAGYPGYENGAYPGYEKNYGGNSGSYGYNKKSEFYRVAKAHRLRCSTIAISSDEDCRTCCQMAARKDRSFTKRSIIGFIVDYSEINQKDYGGYSYKNDYGSSQKRYKRETYAAPPAIAPSNYQTTGTNYGSDKTTSYGNDAYKTDKTESYSTKDNGEKEKNYGDSYKKGNYESSYGSGDYGSEYYPKKHYNKSPRCVCCAPKSHIQDYGQSQYKPQGDKGYGYDNYGKGYSSPGEGAYSGNYEGHYGPKGSESTEGYY